jgi:hypothetical protein
MTLQAAVLNRVTANFRLHYLLEQVARPLYPKVLEVTQLKYMIQENNLHIVADILFGQQLERLATALSEATPTQVHSVLLA